MLNKGILCADYSKDKFLAHETRIGNPDLAIGSIRLFQYETILREGSALANRDFPDFSKQ